MNEDDASPKSTAWIADSGLFIACGRRENSKYVALERFARGRGITFVIPPRVYEELGGAPDRSTPGHTPIDAAIDGGWVTVADEPDYTNGTVSSAMDETRRSIASASNRSEDTVEKTDTALAATAVQVLESGRAERVYLVTTDIAAGNAVVSALDSHGFEGSVTLKNGFELIDEIT